MFIFAYRGQKRPEQLQKERRLPVLTEAADMRLFIHRMLPLHISVALCLPMYLQMSSSHCVSAGLQGL